MLGKLLIVSGVMLVLASWEGVNATKISCGDMSAEDCKKEFALQSEKIAMVEMTDIFKNRMTKTIDMYTAIKDQLPADDRITKMVGDAIDRMKAALPLLDTLDGMDMEKMETTVKTILESMIPEFDRSGNEDNIDRKKYDELLDEEIKKMGILIDNYFIKVKEDFVKSWLEMYSGLREIDHQTYPQYKEMKELVDSMDEMNKDKSIKTFMTVMRKTMELNPTPFIKAIVDIMCEGC